MLWNTLTFAAIALQSVHAQRTTYTGCSNETVSGNILYGCLGPAGTRTVFETYAATTAAATTTAAGGQTTAMTDCHTSSGTAGVLCTNGAGTEVIVQATPTGEVPATYSGCHEHSPGET